MALATSASEFFTSIVGVFFVKSDIARKLNQCKKSRRVLRYFKYQIKTKRKEILRFTSFKRTSVVIL